MNPALEFAAAAGILVAIFLVVQAWSGLPAKIPTHFAASGRVNAWGRRETILLFPALSVIIHAGLSLLSRFPHLYNYPWPITPENADRQYQLASSLLGWLRMETVWLFVYIEWMTIQAALGRAIGHDAWLLWAALAAIFATLGWYFRSAYRAR